MKGIIQERLAATGISLNKRYKGDLATMPDVSLFCGDSGALLFQCLCCNDEEQPALYSNLAAIIDSIGKAGSFFPPTFCGGLAGVGWLFNYMLVSLNWSYAYCSALILRMICQEKQIALRCILALVGSSITPPSGALRCCNWVSEM